MGAPGRASRALRDDACRIFSPQDTVGSRVKAAYLTSTLGNVVTHHRGVARGSPFLQFGGAEVSPMVSSSGHYMQWWCW